MPPSPPIGRRWRVSRNEKDGLGSRPDVPTGPTYESPARFHPPVTEIRSLDVVGMASGETITRGGDKRAGQDSP